MVLLTVTANGPYSIHVCNTNSVPATFRIALVESAYVLPGGNTPALYHFVEYDRPIEGNDSWDTPAFSLNVGDRIVVYASAVGLTFVPAGIAFS